MLLRKTRMFCSNAYNSAKSSKHQWLAYNHYPLFSGFLTHVVFED